MSEFVQRDINNFYNLRWLDTYMIGHKGYIAGGCFKNIFTKTKVKDIDIFFENEIDFNEAETYYNDQEDFELVFKNSKATGYKHNGLRVELIKSKFGKAEEMIDTFDFSIAKFAYYKTIEGGVPSDEFLMDDIGEEDEEVVTYEIVHHKDFFEHLLLKRLVIGESLPFPNSTFERMIRYIKYGFSPCRETKMNIIKAIRENNNPDDVMSESLYFGFD